MNDNKELNDLQAELRQLRSSLQANTSEIGDWKIIKALEYQLIGQDVPYDIEELNTEKQKIRNRINEIETRLLEVELNNF